MFLPNMEIGKDVSGLELTSRYDAVLLAIGSSNPRDLNIPGKINDLFVITVLQFFHEEKKWSTVSIKKKNYFFLF